MPIKLDTRFLQSPHDGGGSGGGSPKVPTGGTKSQESGDAYSGSPLPSAPKSSPSVGKHITASRRPKVKKLTTSQIHAELLKIADELRINDPTGVRRDEARQMLPRALAYLREHFRPEQVALGGPPQDILIRRSLRSAYRRVHPGQTVDRNDAQIEHLIGPFSGFVQKEDVATTLGLRGTKSAKGPVKEKTAPKKQTVQIDVAARVKQARSVFESIQSMGENFADIAEDAAIDVSVFDEITALWSEAQEYMSFLNSLGTSASAVSKSIKSPDDATKVLLMAERISEIADLIRYHHARATTSFEEDRISYYTGFVRADMQAWIGEHAAAARGPLERVLHDYIGFWLAEQAGDTPPGIRHSQGALENAIAGVKLNDETADENADFDSLARRMMHYLIRRESTRSRLTSAAQSRGEAVAAPPISRHMATYDEFAQAIGPDLLASLNEFYRSIQLGEVGGIGTESQRNARASSFNELFIHYVRYAANVYGDHFGPELMRRNGLEPQLVRAIYTRVENARAYGEGPVELLREFFSKYVTDKETPPIAQLIPPGAPAGSAQTVSASDDMKFVQYADGMSMSGFLKKMPFGTGPEFRREFEARTGYSFDAFKRWGSIRPRPKEMTEEAWEAKVDEARELGHLEDVTVEPRTHAALDAILPAFMLLGEHAAREGMAVDIWDYLAAIYPVARSIRASAVDGVIRITVPSFMKNLPFRNWGYPTFAQQIINHKLATEVVRETLHKHAHGEVEQPEYWDIRRYTIPLAEGSGGGIDQQRSLYEFAAGLMRWAHVLDNAAYVYDSGGGLATFAPAGLHTKYQAQLETDRATYLSGSAGDEHRSQRSLFFDIRRGHYDRLLDTLRSYLRQLRELHTEVSLTWSDGRDVKLDTLQEMYFTLAAVHDWYKAMIMDRSATSSTRSEEDLNKIGEFYTDMRTFFEEVVFHMRARGTIGSAQGSVEFEASVRLSEHEYDAEKFGRTTLFLDDAFETSERHGWEIERRDNLITLKVYLGRAIAEGDIDEDEAVDEEKIVEATRRFWSGSEEEFLQAARDLATLEREHRKSKTEESVSGVRRRTAAARSWNLREPALPNRSATDSWADQWRQFADEIGLSHDNAEIAVGAMIAYFQTVPGFYGRFMEGVLASAVDERAESPEDGNAIKRAIAEFFPTIGIANGETQEVRRIDDDTSVESQLAQWAVEDYVIGFPEYGVKETQVPILDEILATFVNVHCMNNIRRHPQPSVVMAKARQILEGYNRNREPQAASLSGKGLKLEREGLLGKRLGDFIEGLELTDSEAAAVRRAYFSLYTEVRENGNIGRSEIEGAIAAAYGSAPAVLVDTLEGFIEKQMGDLAAWRRLVTDPRLGLPAYVRENFHASYVMDEGLVAFAKEYVGDRLTSNVPASPRAISEAIVGDAFSPHKEIAERMAQSYRTLFAIWLERVEAQLEEDLGYMRIALEEISADDVEPVTSAGELISNAEEQVAENLKMKSFDSGTVDQNLATVKYLTGAAQAEPVSDTAATIFEVTVLPALKKAENLASEVKKEAKNEIDEILMTVGAISARSIEIYLDWTSPLDVSRMSEKSLSEFIRQSDSEKADLIELSERLGAYGNSPERIEELEADFGPIPGLTHGIVENLREDIRSSAEQIKTALASIDRSTTAALERLTELEATREERQLAQDAAHVRTTVADTASALSKAIDELAKLEGRVAAAEDMAENIGESLSKIEGDVKAQFDEATARQAKLAEETGDISALIDTLEGRIAKISGADGDYADVEIQVRPLPKAMEMLSSSMAFTTDEAVEEQLELLEQLEQIEEKSRGALASSALMQERLDSILSNITKALDRAEADMPIGTAAGIPKTSAATGEGGAISLTSKSPKGVHSRAQKLLHPLTNGQVLTVGNESYLITASETTRVNFWFRRGRSNTSITRDAFGNPIKLMATLRGVRLDTFSSLPESHPFSVMIGTLNQLFQESSPETALLSHIAKPQHHGLLVELLAHIADGELSGDMGEVLESLRVWYLSNAERIVEALGADAEGFFVFQQSGAFVNYADDNASPDYLSYTPKEHEGRVHHYSEILSHPEIGKMYLKKETGEAHALGDAALLANESTTYYVDTKKARENGVIGQRYIRVFNTNTGSYKNLDLQKLQAASSHPIRVLLEEFPISEQPQRVANLRLMERIYSDPKLMALGWLLANLKPLGLELTTFINQLLKPIRMTPAGQTPPISLLRAQDAAVTAYIDAKFTYNAMPELGRVSDEAIEEYIDTYAEATSSMHIGSIVEGRDGILMTTEERLKNDFRSDTHLRRMLAKAFLASAAIVEIGDKELYNESLKGFIALCNMDKLSASERKQAAEALDDVYREVRPDIISNSRLLQRATGMHAPHVLVGYAEQDDGLAKEHPETSCVGAASMKNLHAVLLTDRAGVPDEHRIFAKVIARLMEIFPEFAGALSIIGTLFTALPRTLREELSNILGEYAQAGRIHEQEDLARFRRRIRNAYSQHAEIILERLSLEQSPGLTFARYLTGMDDPWVDRLDWKNYSTEEALFAIAPEFTKVNREKIEETKKDMLAKIDRLPAPAAKLVMAMLAFMEMHPKLSAAVIMVPAMLKHLPRELANKMFDRFFDYENGAWNNPDVAREIAQETSSADVSSDRLFASLIASNIREVRMALSMPVPEMKGLSTYEWFTGTKEPWKPDIAGTGSVEESYMQLMPLMDLALIQEMGLRDLKKHIESRVARLSLLPGKKKLEQQIFLWREKQKEMIEAGRTGVPNSDSVPELVVEMMLAIEKAEAIIGNGKALPLTKEITASLAKMSDETEASTLRHVYTFMVNHRKEITQATREVIGPKVSVNGKIINGSGSKGGGSGGEGAPPAVSSGGGTAPAAPAPTSSSQGFMGIARSSAGLVHDPKAPQPWAMGACDLHVESGINFMAGTMGAAAVAATAAHASAGMAF